MVWLSNLARRLQPWVPLMADGSFAGDYQFRINQNGVPFHKVCQGEIEAWFCPFPALAAMMITVIRQRPGRKPQLCATKLGYDDTRMFVAEARGTRVETRRDILKLSSADTITYGRMAVFILPGNGKPFSRPAIGLTDCRWREADGYRGLVIPADFLRHVEFAEDLSVLGLA